MRAGVFLSAECVQQVLLQGAGAAFYPCDGSVFSGKREAYEYLVNSIIRFLPVDEFCRLAEECGFEVKRVKMFDGGISFGVFLQKPQKAADASQGSAAR